MSTPEGRVKDAVKKRLIKYGLQPFTRVRDETSGSVAGTFWMPIQGPFSVQGVHDFVGCWHGVFFSIETKAPNNKQDATANQEQFRVAISAAGGIAIVGARDASCVDHVAELIEQRIKT